MAFNVKLNSSCEKKQCATCLELINGTVKCQNGKFKWPCKHRSHGILLDWIQRNDGKAEKKIGELCDDFEEFNVEIPACIPDALSFQIKESMSSSLNQSPSSSTETLVAAKESEDDENSSKVLNGRLKERKGEKEIGELCHDFEKFDVELPSCIPDALSFQFEEPSSSSLNRSSSSSTETLVAAKESEDDEKSLKILAGRLEESEERAICAELRAFKAEKKVKEMEDMIVKAVDASKKAEDDEMAKLTLITYQIRETKLREMTTALKSAFEQQNEIDEKRKKAEKKEKRRIRKAMYQRLILDSIQQNVEVEKGDNNQDLQE